MCNATEWSMARYFTSRWPYTRSEERGVALYLENFQQAKTARVCTLALLFIALKIGSSLLSSLVPSLRLHLAVGALNFRMS